MLCLNKPLQCENGAMWVSGSSPASSCSLPPSQPACLPTSQRSSSTMNRSLSLSLEPLDEDAPWTEAQSSRNAELDKPTLAPSFALRSAPITWRRIPSPMDLRPGTEEACCCSASPFMQASLDSAPVPQQSSTQVAQLTSDAIFPGLLPAIFTARRASTSTLDSHSPPSANALSHTLHTGKAEVPTSQCLMGSGWAGMMSQATAMQPHGTWPTSFTRAVHSLDCIPDSINEHSSRMVRSASAYDLHLQQHDDRVRGGQPTSARAGTRDMKMRGGRVPSRERLDMACSPAATSTVFASLEKIQMAHSTSYLPTNNSILSLSSVDMTMQATAQTLPGSLGSCSNLSFLDHKVHKGLLGEEQRVHGGLLKNSPSKHAFGSSELGLLGSHDSTPGVDEAHLSNSLGGARGVSADARELEGMLDSLWMTLVPQVQARFLDNAAIVDDSSLECQKGSIATVQTLAPSPSLGHVFKVRPGSATCSISASPLAGTQPYSHFSSGSHTALLDMLLTGLGGQASGMPAPSVPRGSRVSEAGAEASPAGSTNSFPTLLAYAERASGQHRALQHQPHTALPTSSESLPVPHPVPTRAASTSVLVRGSMA